MRLLLLALIALILTSCSSRDYHLGMLNETTVNTRQMYHINQINRLDHSTSMMATSSNRICYTYPPAMGSFTTGCKDKQLIN